LYERGQETGYVDIMEYVQMMRKDRMNMIQTKVSFVIKLTSPAFGTISQIVSVVHRKYYCYLIKIKYDHTMIWLYLTKTSVLTVWCFYFI